MKTKYFINCGNLEEMNARYNSLIDLLGLDSVSQDNEVRKEVNSEYNSLKELLEEKARVEVPKPETNAQTVKEIAKVISEMGLESEICGRWLWVSDPKAHQHRDELKNLQFRYSPSKRSWYWRKYEHRSSNSNPVSLEAIREKYGTFRVSP